MYISMWLEYKIDMGMRMDEEKGRVVRLQPDWRTWAVLTYSIGFWGGDIKFKKVMILCYSSV